MSVWDSVHLLIDCGSHARTGCGEMGKVIRPGVVQVADRMQPIKVTADRGAVTCGRSGCAANATRRKSR